MSDIKLRLCQRVFEILRLKCSLPLAAHSQSIIISSLLIVLLLGMLSPLLGADGWYLLVPPRSKYNKNADYLSGYKILEDKPLSKWGQQGAYDTAEECEAMKVSLINTEQNTYKTSSVNYIEATRFAKSQTILEIQRANVEILNANVFALMASRCINSNDPRLKR